MSGLKIKTIGLPIAHLITVIQNFTFALMLTLNTVVSAPNASLAASAKRAMIVAKR